MDTCLSPRACSGEPIEEFRHSCKKYSNDYYKEEEEENIIWNGIALTNYLLGLLPI